MASSRIITGENHSVISEALLDNILEGCQLIGFDWRYIYVNKAVVAQSRKTAEQLLGHSMMETYPGIDKTEMFKLLRRTMHDRQPHTMENEFDFPEGPQGWFELRMEPVEQGVFVFSLDITERKKTELHLKELNELKTKFIDIAAHQLRTPVSIIRWTVETMRVEEIGKIPENFKTKLQTIYKANDNIRLRIDDLLAALNIEESRITLNKTNFQFEDILESIVEKLQANATAKDIHLSVVRPPLLLPKINADLDCIKDILSKLIYNAITYTSSGGKVSITLFLKGKVIRCEISDNGVGIPDADQASIFERFFRGSNASTMEPDGYGLGLYIVRHYIHAHNGRLGFHSKENQGSTFWFELPLAI
jgi:PAS domain S-box-containing protein